MKEIYKLLEKQKLHLEEQTSCVCVYECVCVFWDYVEMAGVLKEGCEELMVYTGQSVYLVFVNMKYNLAACF